MTLNRKDRSKFQGKIERFRDALTEQGIAFRANWSCCQTCGHAEMEGELAEGGEEGSSYMFYHQQTSESLKDGFDELYLAHYIKVGDLAAVIKIVKDFGGDWSGSGNSTICIPFIDFTPQQLKEREEAELQRQKRISIIKKLREEGVPEGDISKRLAEILAQSQ